MTMVAAKASTARDQRGLGVISLVAVGSWVSISLLLSSRRAGDGMGGTE